MKRVVSFVCFDVLGVNVNLKFQVDDVKILDSIWIRFRRRMIFVAEANFLLIV